jgi:Cdc6-like AAA superfamily ATPase
MEETKTPIFIFSYGETGTGKTQKCYEWFKEKYISANTEPKFLRTKYLKENNIKVINVMINPNPSFTRIGDNYFNKFNNERIKFVYFESLYPIEKYNSRDLLNEKIDFIIKFNGNYNQKESKVILNDNESQYEFEKGTEHELTKMIEIKCSDLN